MYKPTTKELVAIIAVAVTTAVVLVSGDFGVVSAALVGIFFALAELWRITRKSTRTHKQASS